MVTSPKTVLSPRRNRGRSCHMLRNWSCTLPASSRLKNPLPLPHSPHSLPVLPPSLSLPLSPFHPPDPFSMSLLFLSVCSRKSIVYLLCFRPPFSEKGRIGENGWKRVSYIVRMFLAELGLSQWRSREFWVMFILFIFTFFLRLFLHYTGQYLFLKAIKIPINRSVLSQTNCALRKPCKYSPLFFSVVLTSCPTLSN